MQYLRDKYSYMSDDGRSAINHLFGSSGNAEYATLAECLTLQVKTDVRSSMRELGSAIVNLRNSIMHTNDRECINDNISVENSKRFLIIVDLFVELDQMFFSPQAD